MSTHRFIPAKRKGRGLSFLSMLGGLLITLQLLLTPTAFAASGRVNAAMSLSPQGIVDLAGVSVVRLVISYTVAKPPSTVTCTALGTIIASWPATSASERNTWVLTDGSILNFSGGSCHPGGKLAGIRVYASSEYAGRQSPLMIAQLSCSNPICSDGPTASSGPVEVLSTLKGNGGALFSFHSDPAHMQPYLSLEQTTLPGASIGVELVGSSGTPPATPQVQTTAIPPLDLTPTQSTAPSTSTPGVGTAPPVFEPGTPYVDSNGNVAGMQLFGTTTHLSVANIQALENQEVELQQATAAQKAALSGKLNSNTLNMQWDAGIEQYEQGHYTLAVQTLQSIQPLNPNFQAASTYATLAEQKIAPQQTATATANTTQGNQGSPKVLGIIPASWVLVVGLVAGVLVLVLLFLLVSIVFGRRRIVRKRELESFDADVKRARQN
ncbi:MAG TPA: hypothetical protein VKR83_09200, partial [Ktedonobacteraceae bacterium]|nr:hypothetical protein [Ktedonobacteraceae bacterium]